MGAVARRSRRRPSGTVTLTGPGSSGGGWSGLAGRTPVPAQAAGWVLALAGVPPCCVDGAGRAAAMARTASAQTYRTVCRWKDCQSRDLVLVEAGQAFCLLVTFLHRPSPPADHDQCGQGHRASGRGVAVEEGEVTRVGAAAADQRPVPRRPGAGLAPGPAGQRPDPGAGGDDRARNTRARAHPPGGQRHDRRRAGPDQVLRPRRPAV